MDCEGFSKCDEVSAKYSDWSAMCVRDLLSLLRDLLGVLGSVKCCEGFARVFVTIISNSP